MPNPQFLKPWHGIPREQIEWHPTVDENACIGCGTCVTGCSRMVYRYDYEKLKSVVADPLNCMVGCTTCANTCPTHAIHFPSLSNIFALEARPEVHHAIEDELIARRGQLEWKGAVPHPDRVVTLEVAKLERPGKDILILSLKPRSATDCFCQFMPGQYVEILPAEDGWLPRAYSIGNAPREDGGLELQIRRTPDGRMTKRLFEQTKVGDLLHVRGPRGTFTMRSLPDRALVFVAGGTGFAPIKALIEQQLALNSNRRMVLFWGVGTREDLYELELIGEWLKRANAFDCMLAIDRGALPESLPPKLKTQAGNVAQVVLASGNQLPGMDAYVAGPPVMMPGTIEALIKRGINGNDIFIDSFGL